MKMVKATFAPRAESARAARQLVMSTLSSSPFAASADVACLLTSELVTNVLLHAGTPFDVRVVVDDDCLTVSVHDQDSRLPAVREPSEPPACSGRGLRLLEDLSSDWGYREESVGKSVWFELTD